MLTCRLGPLGQYRTHPPAETIVPSRKKNRMVGKYDYARSLQGRPNSLTLKWTCVTQYQKD